MSLNYKGEKATLLQKYRNALYAPCRNGLALLKNINAFRNSLNNKETYLPYEQAVQHTCIVERQIIVPVPCKITSLLLHLKINLPEYFHQILWMFKMAMSMVKDLRWVTSVHWLIHSWSGWIRVMTLEVRVYYCFLQMLLLLCSLAGSTKSCTVII